MKAKLDCFSCFLRIGLQAARMAGATEDQQRVLMSQFLDVLKNSEDAESPLACVHHIQQIVRRETGVADPYREIKDACNADAGSWLPHLRKEVANADNALMAALKVAAIGNIMDYGAFSKYDIGSLIDRLHHSNFMVDASPAFEQRLSRARSLAYIADNTGEIYFDSVLINQLLDNYNLDRLQLIIRNSPFLNDVSSETHLPISLRDHPKIELSQLSVVPSERDPATWQSITTSDIVLCKGMANYENYSEVPGFFFLLIAKCDLVSELIAERTNTAVKTGDWILLHNDKSYV